LLPADGRKVTKKSLKIQNGLRQGLPGLP
jgi:hypothetical protein